MKFTTLIPATIVACSGFAAAAPNSIPTATLTWPASAPTPVLDDYKGVSSGPGQSNGDDGREDESTLEKRGWERTIRICENANRSGACVVKSFKPETGCYNLAGWWNDKISSVYLPPHTTCTLFTDKNCQGKWLKAFDPGYSNLKTQSLMNDKASSIICAAR
ncbi:Beta/gamma crystallin [Neofusicoccum parvum]|uniref:Beta/gamma crystallin n=1 Tax=Neofusicoccum parvum TaxID=310453 RepID=A0ACB5RN21_9PEZI|nr:Beta/gamma crystallin [Neofusicoccum parvum]